MNSIQNYGMTNNYQRVNFKANTSKMLDMELCSELIKSGNNKKYLKNIYRRLSTVAPGVTVKSVSNEANGMRSVTLQHKSVEKSFEIPSKSGSKLDVMEGLLDRNKSGFSTLSDYAYKFFGVY